MQLLSDLAQHMWFTRILDKSTKIGYTLNTRRLQCAEPVCNFSFHQRNCDVWSESHIHEFPSLSEKHSHCRLQFITHDNWCKHFSIRFLYSQVPFLYIRTVIDVRISQILYMEYADQRVPQIRQHGPTERRNNRLRMMMYMSVINCVSIYTSKVYPQLQHYGQRVSNKRLMRWKRVKAGWGRWQIRLKTKADWILGKSVWRLCKSLLNVYKDELKSLVTYVKPHYNY